MFLYKIFTSKFNNNNFEEIKIKALSPPHYQFCRSQNYRPVPYNKYSKCLSLNSNNEIQEDFCFQKKQINRLTPFISIKNK